MKKSLLLLLSLALLTTGCTYQQADEQTSPTTENEPTVTTGVTKEFSMVAKKWDFDPSEITVNQGDNVKLTIKSIDVKHGISIPEFGVKADLNPNEETVVEFKADKSGTFTFSCSVFCGSGHKDMKGTLIVN